MLKEKPVPAWLNIFTRIVFDLVLATFFVGRKEKRKITIYYLAYAKLI